MEMDIRDLSFGYGKKKILEEIGFSSKKGEMIALLGPNGSGKTTLLKLISKVLNPKSGIITMGNVDISEVSPKELAKNMAVIPQQFDTTFSFTAEEIVLMGRTPHLNRWEKEKERDYDIVKNAMLSTNTWQFRENLFFNLSGGEKQRVIIARALAQEPKILLLDEPTSNLDITHQIEILSTIKDLVRERELMVLAAFHDLNLAAQYFDKILMLHNGKIFAKGSPEEVLTKHNINHVYGVEVIVKRNPLSDAIYVVPHSRPKAYNNTSNLKIHVICGEGSGSTILNRLSECSYKISLGVINMLDTDWETADLLELRDIITEAPFSPISRENHNSNVEAIDKAELVIVTDFSIGTGNLKNLEAAKYALDKSIPLLLLEKIPVEERDFTDGKATKIINYLKNNGAKTFNSKRKLIEHIKNINK